MRKLIGLTILVIGTASTCPCFAIAAPTPEIDGSTAGAAVALLLGGLLVIQYRRKK